MSDINSGESEESVSVEQVKVAAELARENIRRFLELQGKDMGPLKMIAHDEEVRLAGEAARLSAELSAINIRRFLNLQSESSGPLKMQAHAPQQDS